MEMSIIPRLYRWLFGNLKTKKPPSKTSIKDYRIYECKLCGKVFEPKYLGYQILSAYTQIKRHLLIEHGKKSVKKKYCKKYSFFNNK